MYPVVILETTKDERKKLIIIVGLLINRVSVELIDLLRREIGIYIVIGKCLV